jgi:hypothetical protein
LKQLYFLTTTFVVPVEHGGTSLKQNRYNQGGVNNSFVMLSSASSLLMRGLQVVSRSIEVIPNSSGAEVTPHFQQIVTLN